MYLVAIFSGFFLQDSLKETAQAKYECGNRRGYPRRGLTKPCRPIHPNGTICVFWETIIIRKANTGNTKDIKALLATPDMCFLMFFMLRIFVRDVFGVLTSTPRDVAVVNGTIVNLQCSTDTSEDLWWFRLVRGAQTEDHIVDGSEVNARFRSFYSVLHENQMSTLTIVATQLTAATYACVEMFTTKRASGQVIVLESEPSCSSNVTGDVLNFTCVVAFRGQGNPLINWTQLVGKEEKEVNVGIVNTQEAGQLVTHTSTLIVQTDESKRNFLAYIYRYTVKFCSPDNASRITNGSLCIFSKPFPAIGEEASITTSQISKEATGTTSGISEEIAGAKSRIFVSGHGLLWILMLIPILGFTGCLLLLGIYFYRKNRLNRTSRHQLDKDEQTGAGLIEMSS